MPEERAVFEFESTGLRFRIEGPVSWVDTRATALLQRTPTKPEQQDEQAGSEPKHWTRWLQQQKLSKAEIETVMHIEGEGAEVIAPTLPGNAKEKTLNGYLLVGLQAYITDPTRKFPDALARELLKKYSAYDPDNHAQYMKALVGKFAGNKEDGWVLTIPGLSAVADLVRRIATQK